MNHLNNEDFVFKFVIIGDSGVGKSCIMHHHIFNKCNIILITIIKREKLFIFIDFIFI